MRLDTRVEAHGAMRKLWQQADTLRRQASQEDGSVEPYTMIETEKGARISEMACRLVVSAEFEKPDGTTEITEVIFPEDIRDMSTTEVYTTWCNNRGRSGVNTVPLRQFPEIAREMGGLLT